MQNLLVSSQIKDVDTYTIQHEPIVSIELMERAALAFVNAFINRFGDEEATIWVCCGQGNNGGDGLAIARLLRKNGYTKVKVFLANYAQKTSPDYLRNLERLKQEKSEIPILEDLQALKLRQNDIVIDAILGSGLNKPLSGKYEKLAVLINTSKSKVVAVDVPTGFKSEGELDAIYNGVKADFVISFQVPKINFFFPESIKAIREFEVVSIGLDEPYIESLPSQWKLVTEQFINKTIKPRARFSHKGTYGHALIVAGDTETMGAALLSVNACLQAGVGLVSACIPQSGLTALNVSLPEAMYFNRENLSNTDLQKYQAIAIGSGLGIGETQEQLLEQLLSKNKPLLIDADALNILSENKELLKEIPAQSVLTPHMKEFDRLFGHHDNWWNRVEMAKKKAIELELIIVLKNQYTFICLPTGDICVNPTGNPAMAQGGMGDVLTGIITSFLAQGYNSSQAVILGVYLHGKAGDILAENREIVTASALAKSLPKVLKNINSEKS
ncbi:NAD(P)H-hydrate dehydratase [Pedobacter xixiisoli]|uniref:Bifunctional NAD(P)H-hydrate repair enzyme n=1 Tax=Pedobacter xixiisoli TaxID=1476464 RepID=A0A286A846_9SPHI|nr:NAD(P)H-hydrate dehydratase [Pedobacter xixiisoli]SOD18090.1 NAD(P)H-hydrate epimerase [Pedobacter xixiisoli]